MAKKVIVKEIYDFQATHTNGNASMCVYETTTGEIEFSGDVSLDLTGGVNNAADLITLIETSVLANVQASGYPGIVAADIIYAAPNTAPQGMKHIPIAAIANAPADAVTNYNVVTTLLGALTGAVNTANGKQNDIATKLNSVLATLRTVGIIVP